MFLLIFWSLFLNWSKCQLVTLDFTSGNFNGLEVGSTELQLVADPLITIQIEDVLVPIDPVTINNLIPIPVDPSGDNFLYVFFSLPLVYLTVELERTSTKKYNDKILLN